MAAPSSSSFDATNTAVAAITAAVLVMVAGSKNLKTTTMELICIIIIVFLFLFLFVRYLCDHLSTLPLSCSMMTQWQKCKRWWWSWQLWCRWLWRSNVGWCLLWPVFLSILPGVDDRGAPPLLRHWHYHQPPVVFLNSVTMTWQQRCKLTLFHHIIIRRS